MIRIKVIFALVAAILLAGCSINKDTSISIDSTTTNNITSIHDLGDGRIIAYNHERQTIWLLSFNGTLNVVATAPAKGNVWKVAPYNDEILVGYGYGRDMLDKPVHIVKYDNRLKQDQTIFSTPSSRSQITELRQLGDDIFISFFDSKYFTVAGLLKQNNNWKLDQQYRIRLATEFDFDGKNMIIGRAYGDDIGIDGDVTLYTENSTIKLPSFRGVSAVKFAQIDNDTEKEILIADGWHQNYGTIAEPRISVLDFNGTKYSLQMIGNATPQYAINRIYHVNNSQKQRLITIGNSHVDMYSMDGNRQTIYTTKNPYFDAIYLGNNQTHAFIAILDTNIMIKEILLT